MDAYEEEREEAAAAALAKAATTKKQASKGKKKKTTVPASGVSDSSGQSSATDRAAPVSPSTTSAIADPPSTPLPSESPPDLPTPLDVAAVEPVGGTSKPKPKPRAKPKLPALTKKANGAIRKKVAAVVDVEERRREIVRLNGLSEEELKAEGEAAEAKEQEPPGTAGEQTPASGLGLDQPSTGNVAALEAPLPATQLFEFDFNLGGGFDITGFTGGGDGDTSDLASMMLDVDPALALIPPLPADPNVPFDEIMPPPPAANSFPFPNMFNSPERSINTPATGGFAWNFPPADELLPTPAVAAPVPAQETTPAATTAERIPAVVAAPSADLNSMPPWIRVPFEEFCNEPIPEEDSAMYREMLGDWGLLESIWNFRKEVRDLLYGHPLMLICCQRVGFSTKNRAPGVGKWVKNARNGRMTQYVDDKEAFVEKWYLWWDAINPEWRERRDGQLVTGGSGDWSTMYLPGPNGFLNVLGALVALRDMETPERWSEAMRDVRWVIGQVLAAKQEERCVRRALQPRPILKTSTPVPTPRNLRMKLKNLLESAPGLRKHPQGPPPFFPHFLTNICVFS